MAAEPFCATPCYAPWVATGNRNHARLPCLDKPSCCTIYRLVLIEQGSLRAEIAGTGKVIRPGQMLLLRPATAYHLEAGRNLRLTSCTFSVTALPDLTLFGPGLMLGRLRTDPQPPTVWGCPLPEVLPPDDIARVRPVLHRITATWWQGPWEHFTANRMLGDLLARWTASRRNAGCMTVPPQRPGLAELTAFAEQRLEQGITVDDLAEFAGLSRSHFSRSFRQEAGQSPRDFLHQVRLDRAQRLLTTTAIDCRAIARHCGYASYSAFARRFHARFAHWPSAGRASTGHIRAGAAPVDLQHP